MSRRARSQRDKRAETMALHHTNPRDKRKEDERDFTTLEGLRVDTREPWPTPATLNDKGTGP
jgi:hypothetical protein